MKHPGSLREIEHAYADAFESVEDRPVIVEGRDFRWLVAEIKALTERVIAVEEEMQRLREERDLNV